MKSNQLVNMLNIQNADAGKLDRSFLVIYPHHPNRAAVIAELLQNSKALVHYFALALDEDTSTAGFLKRLTSDSQFPSNFGQQLRQALDKSNNPTTWAEAFAADLGALHREHYLLILDQVDVMQYEPSFVPFFEALAGYLPQHIQIVINGRDLARQPWEALIEQGKAQVVGKEEASTGSQFNAPTDIGQIEFYSISGRTQIISDGFTVETWDGALPRNLCYYFIEQRQVTRREIFEIFWPHLGIKEATNVFHVTKRKISEKLGYEITDYRGGMYGPSDDVVIYYDAREFEDAYDSAMRTSGNTSANHFYRAVHLYRHAYLPEVDMPWANAKREKLADDYVQALLELGRYNEAQKENEVALGYYLRAVHAKPEREDLHRTIMQLYSLQGNLDDAVHQYRVLEKELKRRFNLTPSKETRQLYETLTKS